MNKLKTLVLMQLKDKLNVKNGKKETLRILFIELLKIIIVTVIAYLIFYLLTTLVFSFDETPKLLVLVTSFSMILSIIVATIGLMKSLYFSEDNKVLITFPVAPNLIFISKIIVYYLYEIKKNLTFLIPIYLSSILIMVTRNLISPLIIFWMFIPMLFILMIPVLVGSLLSIPLMYITRFLKRFSVIEVILTIIGIVLSIFVIVKLIGLIPSNIDLIGQWPTIRKSLKEFLLFIEKKLFFFSQLVYIIFGEKTSNLKYGLSLFTFAKFGILVLGCVILFFLGFVLSRPLFFNMMSKNFEINKSKSMDKPNVRHNKYFAFIKKEFIINIRSIDISLNYLIIYIAVPILIMFLNALYHVMETRHFGNLLIYTFNVLLICLPLLASNALVATYYSKEGRAGYIKKTKPIYALYPLFTKLFFNILFSIPTVFVTVYIFGSYSSFTFMESFVLSFSILFLHLGHMIYSAMLDIMNPQNEQYATTGIEIDNPNENKSTIFAFIISIIFALITYKLLSEATIGGDDMSLIPGMLKLLLISIIYLGSNILLFTKRVRAFYYDLQG